MKSFGLLMFCLIGINSYSQKGISESNQQAFKMYAETLDEDDPFLYYLEQIAKKDETLERRSDYNFVLDSIWNVDTLADSGGQWLALGEKSIFEYDEDNEYETIWQVKNQGWEKQSKIQRRYDENSNLLEHFEVVYLEDDSLEFVPFLKINYSYNENSLIISVNVISYQYTDSITVIYNRRTEYEYSANNRLVRFKVYDIIDIGVEELLTDATYNYNSFNLPTSVLQYFYNAISDSLSLCKKIIYTYGNDNLLSEVETTSFNESGIVDDLEILNYYYDSLSRTAAIVRTQYFDSNQIIVGDSTNYFYNEDGRLVLNDNWDWDLNTSEYLIDFEVTNIYDANQILIQKSTFSQFDFTTEEFTRKEFKTYGFDNFYNLIVIQTDIEYINLMGEEDFQNDWVRLEFNNAVPIDDIKLPLHLTYPFQSFNMLKRVSFSPEENELGLPTGFNTVNYFYTEQETSSINTVKKENDLFVKIIPNPAWDNIKLQLPSDINLVDLVIVNQSGKEVFKGSVHNNQNLSIADFPSGLYVYKVTSGSKINTGKIIKI